MVQINTIMVVGAGQMGRGISLLAAKCGFHVLLHDLVEAHLRESVAAIGLELSSHPELSDTEAARAIARIRPASSLQESVRADYVIESATENITIKQQIFAALANYTTEHTVLATNTSSLSVSDIASVTDCPERVIGLHFLYPAMSMQLVEMIRGLKTSEQSCNITRKIAHDLGKEAIEVNDYPGFVSNRLLMPMINEAIILVFDGVADVESVDRIMQLGMQYPLGPLQLADMIGLDTCLSIMEILHRSLDEPKYRPCPLLRTMVKAGKLGRKSGEGFYFYDN